MVEGLGGYVFGLVMYVLLLLSLSARAVDWARKSRYFSAGTRAEIVFVCVNVVLVYDLCVFDV